MDCIFKNVRIVDPQSTHHFKQRDVWIKNGKIFKVASNIIPPKNCKILQSKNSYLSPAWVDIACYGGEPGYEERETLDKLCNAALYGGYSRICYMPNTNPAIHSKSEVHFIINKATPLGIYIHPIGSVSKNNESLEMSEILQMHESGAVAFSEGNHGIQKSGFLKRVLEYLKLIPTSLLIQHSSDEDLAPNAQVHESSETSNLGLRISPALSEFTAVQRDISILEYTESRMLINKISSAESVNLIRKSKKKLTGLYASVSIFNLCFTDSDMSEFSSHLKLLPPLRGFQDQKYLWLGLKDNTIDIIISDHTPINPELKDLEFQNAAFGAISLETCFSGFVSLDSSDGNIEMWVHKTSINPRQILSLPSATIEEGADAELTWFDPSMKWIYKSENVKSLSKNSPWINKELNGKILAVYNKSQLFLTTNIN